MPCCKSMLARRIVLWYILIGAFVIFPVTLNVSLGCRFINVGFENQDEIQSFGAYSVAIYDPEARGNNHFLGCVKPSEYWQEETGDDFGFTTLKVSSAFLLALTSLASLICICLQCFTKNGKTHLWAIMRVCYTGAAFSQGVMYAVYASDMCQTPEETDDDSNFEAFLVFNFGERTCRPGHTGILGVVNFALLVGMVIATMVSLPPRNPVFQCWGGDLEYDEYSEGSTSDEDSVIRKWKAIQQAESHDDSVSLFSGSRRSRRKSVKTDDADAASAAEKGLSNVSVSSKKSKGSTIPSKMEKYAVTDETSVKSGKSKSSRKSSASKKSKKSTKDEVVLDTVDESPSVSSPNSKSSIPGVAKYLKKKQSTDDNVSRASSKRSKGSKKLKPVEETVPETASDILNTVSSAMSAVSSATGTSGTTLEVTNFVIQLIEMTELKEGGRRIKLEDCDNQVEIVDVYPTSDDGTIHSTPSSDVAAVRTEFYELGSRTIKEITHRDGSKTVMTTIVVETSDSSTVGKDQGPPKPLEPPVEYSLSAGSIESTSISKYEVANGTSSVTTYKGNNHKEVLAEGDLALSVGTASVKSMRSKSSTKKEDNESGVQSF